MDKQRINQLLESRDPADSPARYIQCLVLALIMLSTAAMIFETLPSMAGMSNLFRTIEVVAITFFTTEYVLRIWSCSAQMKYSNGLIGTLKFIISPMALIDLLAILPFYLTFLPIDLRFVRMFRIMRILRLAKLARYSEALNRLGHVVADKRYELSVTLFIGFILLVVFSCLVYFAENPAQPERFTSIPATMWWAIATLTTVGYGDLYPITPVGKLAGAVVAITGIGMFALPTGILGAAFVEALSSNQLIEQSNVCQQCGHSLVRAIHEP